MMRTEVKICGVRDAAAIAAAFAGGARYVGFVFYPPSPRSLEPEAAAQLARLAPTGLRTVGLFVDADDALLDRVVGAVPLALLQLHGRESVARVAAIRERFGIPVMKAIRVAATADLDVVPAYAAVADRLLFDAKLPERVAALPGGNGIAFDWSILTGRDWPRPWMLSGGLNPGNLAAALAATGAPAVDVSSGVESRPGVKDPALIAAFLDEAARSDRTGGH